MASVLRDVDPFAAAVIAFAGIPLGVLVGHHAAHRFAHGFARVVFRRDQLQVLLLALFLAGDCGENLGIFGFDVTAREYVHEGPPGKRSNSDADEAGRCEQRVPP